MKYALRSVITATECFGRWFGEITSWLVLGTLISVLIAVIAGALGANEMLSWGMDLPILGTKLTINGIFDLEWHFLQSWLWQAEPMPILMTNMSGQI